MTKHQEMHKFFTKLTESSFNPMEKMDVVLVYQGQTLLLKGLIVKALEGKFSNDGTFEITPTFYGSTTK